MSKLKPYIVCGTDMVAATSPHQALQLWNDYTGDDQEDYASLCVEDASEWLDEMVRDEEGADLQTLQQMVDDCNGVPQYLYGWE